MDFGIHACSLLSTNTNMEMEDHKIKVDTVAASVCQFHETKRPFRIYHGSTNSTRQSQYRRDNIVDTSSLTNIWGLDRRKKTVLAEPNVPMDKLVDYTLSHAGLVPLVVMEFPGITVGGGFSGTSGESSSFRHGVFHRTIAWIEIVLGNGQRTVASPDDDHQSDLFWGAASAFGTLGIVTLLEVKLMEARPYVELTYHPVSNVRMALEKSEEVTADPTNDYLDGIMFARDQIVICSGRLVKDVPAAGSTTTTTTKVQRFTRAQDQWFYRHVEKRVLPQMMMMTGGDPTAAPPVPPLVDYIPLVDYLFRYDRGAFWTGKYAFQYFLTPFNRITRYMLDTFMHTRVMYHALHESGFGKRYIVQDVAVPYAALNELTDWLHRNFSYYPLWLCPLKEKGEHGNNNNNNKPGEDRGQEQIEPEYYMNVGIWGPGSTDRLKFVEQNRQIEAKVMSLGGQKCLYAQAYYAEDEFWASSPSNRNEYDALREKYHASYLPSVYDKVSSREGGVDDVEAKERARRVGDVCSWVGWLQELFWGIWPLAGLYGVYKAWRGGDYLLQKERTVVSKFGLASKQE